MSIKDKVVAVLDKNIDQEQLGKDLLALAVSEVLKPKAEALKAKIASGEIDLIKGTQIDNELLLKIVDGLVGKIEA